VPHFWLLISVGLILLALNWIALCLTTSRGAAGDPDLTIRGRIACPELAEGPHRDMGSLL
jgi:hypothetical protein